MKQENKYYLCVNIDDNCECLLGENALCNGMTEEKCEVYENYFNTQYSIIFKNMKYEK